MMPHEVTVDPNRAAPEYAVKLYGYTFSSLFLGDFEFLAVESYAGRMEAVPSRLAADRHIIDRRGLHQPVVRNLNILPVGFLIRNRLVPVRIGDDYLFTFHPVDIRIGEASLHAAFDSLFDGYVPEMELPAAIERITGTLGVYRQLEN